LRLFWFSYRFIRVVALPLLRSCLKMRLYCEDERWVLRRRGCNSNDPERKVNRGHPKQAKPSDINEEGF